jgi:hypothetical protein
MLVSRYYECGCEQALDVPLSYDAGAPRTVVTLTSSAPTMEEENNILFSNDWIGFEDEINDVSLRYTQKLPVYTTSQPRML